MTMMIEYGAAIFVCLFLGYWCVSRFIDAIIKKAHQEAKEQRDGQEEAEAQQEANEQRNAHEEAKEPGKRTTDCYQILGISPTASIEEIKSKYRRLVQQYHPDRVADMGIELRNVASEKMKELNTAYEQALKQRT
jgi:DnaJ-domain-containing protein 1